MKLFYAFLFIIIGQTLSFIQLQGQLAWKFARDNTFIMVLMGLPISYVIIKATKLFNDHFATNWPGRVIGFGVGIIIFSIMSWFIFKELPTMKTIVCLMLAFSIIFIQIFWK